MRVLESTFVAALALLALHGQQALGCSHVRVSIPGADVIGRTMEVGGDGGEATGLLSRRLVGAEGFTWMVNVHPRNRSMGFPAPCGRGITWKNALGFVSVDVAIELGGAKYVRSLCAVLVGGAMIRLSHFLQPERYGGGDEREGTDRLWPHAPAITVASRALVKATSCQLKLSATRPRSRRRRCAGTRIMWTV